MIQEVKLQHEGTSYSEQDRWLMVLTQTLRQQASQMQANISLDFGCHAIHRAPCPAVQDEKYRQRYLYPT